MIAASYMKVPYRPIPADCWRYLWDHAIRTANVVSRNQFFDVHLAVGLHMGAKIEDTDDLLAALPAYCALDETVAVGETGIDPIQRGGDAARWPLEEQRDVLHRQMEIAEDHDLPVILHTPANIMEEEGGSVSSQMGAGLPHKFGRGTPYSEPLVDMSKAKPWAVELDVETAREVGFPEERLVIDHADESVVEYVMNETDCYLSFSLCHGTVDVHDIAAIINDYGPGRVMVNTDLGNPVHTEGDAFLIRRLILDLLRLGITPEEVRQVVYENPKGVLGLSYSE